MARYIDADELIKKIKENIETFDKYKSPFRYDVVDGLKIAISCVELLATADVVPKSEEGAECPTCHGTGRIGTTDWLTKNISKEQLAKEKAEAIVEHELHIKQDYAREIFDEIETSCRTLEVWGMQGYLMSDITQLKKKYTESEGKE